jgi:hypothetical protein
MNSLIVSRIQGRERWALLMASETESGRYRVLSYFLSESAKDIFCSITGITPSESIL